MTIDGILKQEKVSKSEQIKLVAKLSLPAIMAELTSIAEQYIDAAMVGKLGANSMASIGLVSTTTWLIGGMCLGLASGFSVQVAHNIGAGDDKQARDVLRQGMIVLAISALIIAVIAMSISPYLPGWLGGEKDIRHDASVYFFIYACTIPFAQMRHLGSSMLQCSGNMKTPSILNSMLCLLDVIFNMIFIFPSHKVAFFGIKLKLYGFNLGVYGAAIGTMCAEVVISFIMMYFLCVRSKKLSLRQKGSWKLTKNVLANAVKIGIPMTLDHIFMCCAYVAGTVIIAPLGSVAVAANSLAVTAESLCYMPGYGISSAATVLVGQSVGAGRKKLVKSFSLISTALGMTFMGLMAVLMYILAPQIFSILTTDAATAALGAKVIRIELISEPLYAASIVCAGSFRGEGDTLIPSIMNLVSMWGVRIVLASFLVPQMGLTGYWTAMCIELCFRGIIFLIRLFLKTIRTR